MGDIQQDPSMEEILASIKRVIREDGRVPSQAARSVPRRNGRSEPVPPAPPVPPEEDVLELDDPVEAEDGLISDNAAAASRQSLAALTAMRAPQPAPVSGGALENVVRDMLRPILKEWLDEHLPQIVEELVTREITRITGRNI
jgi:cell pole-organizing protein PopZ